MNLTHQTLTHMPGFLRRIPKLHATITLHCSIVLAALVIAKRDIGRNARNVHMLPILHISIFEVSN